MNLIATLRAISSTGLSLSSQAVRYTLYKTLLDRPYRHGDKPPAVQLPEALVEVLNVTSGARFHFTNSVLEIIFLAPDLARLSWEPGSPPLPYALARTEWPAVHIDLCQEPDGYSLTSNDVQIKVFSDGSLEFRDPQGRLLRHEYPPERLVYKKGKAGWGYKAALNRGESLYGLGERAGGLDLRGGTYRLWNNDPGGSYPPGKDPLYLSVPAYISLQAAGTYLVFYENSFSGTVSFAAEAAPGEKEAACEVTFEDGMLRSYFIPGPPPRMLERFTELTGRAPLPPRWVLGYHQSRWGYRTAEEVRQVMSGFKEHDMPLSAIHLDIDYMDGYRVFTVDKQRFPSLRALADELHQQGVCLVEIIDAGVKKDPGYSFYQSGLKQDMFCKGPDGKIMEGLVWPGWSVFADFTNPQVRQAWGEQYPVLLDQGMAGIWHDMNEPTCFVAWGDMTLPLSTCHDLDGRTGDHAEAHNTYALLMNQAAFEGLRRLYPERRPWILSRSGYAGLQRYAWNWTGDTETSWETLHSTIGTVLGLGLSGIPFTGPDVGGFSGNPSAELYIRWLQMASFLPFFRTHSSLGTSRREPWVYGEPYTSIARQVLRNRYRLLPYLYTSVWQSCQTGVPMARPLFWHDPADERLRKTDDAFLLGDDLLVAPVLKEGALQRDLILPAGPWINLWDGSRLDGPAQVTLAAPIERIPVLVRGGSILSMQEDGSLALHVYPVPGEHRSFMFDDEGEGYGPTRLDRYTMRVVENRLSIRCEPQGDYKYDYAKLRITVHGIAANSSLLDVVVDGRTHPVAGNQFECDPFEEITLSFNSAI